MSYLSQNKVKNETTTFWYGVEPEYPIQVYGLYHPKTSGLWDMNYAESLYRMNDHYEGQYGRLADIAVLHKNQQQRGLVNFVQVLMSRYEFNSSTNTLTFKELQPGEGYYHWYDENLNYTARAHHESYNMYTGEQYRKYGPYEAPGAP